MNFQYLKNKIVFCAILFGATFSFVFSNDTIFPFSNYPMYSRKFEPQEGFSFLITIIEDVDGEEQDLKKSHELKPFWRASFHEALVVENDLKRIRLKLKAALTWINAKRAAHNMKKIKKLKLMRVFVPLKQAINRQKQESHDHKYFKRQAKLITEVSIDE